MSLEQAILTHAAAIEKLALAIANSHSAAPAVTIGSTNMPAVVVTDAQAEAPKEKPVAKKQTPAPAAKSQEGATEPLGAEAQASGAASSITYDNVKTKILEVAKAKPRDVTAALLARFGCTKGPDLKEAQWPEFMEKAQGVLDGTYDPLASEAPAEDEQFA